MARVWSKLGLILGGAYLALFAAMAAMAIYILVTDTANSEFSGMGMILITFPWCLLWGQALAALGINAWYDRFADVPALFGVLASLTILPAALPYSVIAYLLGRTIERARRAS